MRRNRFGPIINITSIHRHAGQLGQTNCCASKAGITGFTKALAREEAHNGVTATCLAPGTCATAWRPPFWNDLKQITAEIPMQRPGQLADSATAVIFWRRKALV
jgi:NAD(P)-dependent dehydrogenase (short-subunit alcohol dehydrogenase family)